VLQHGLDLLPRHAREPLQKLVDPSPALQVLEKRLYRYARALEQPGTAHLAGDALDG
jgi:hypothetical protein